MSEVEAGAGHRDRNEIIIVRRNRVDEGEHHSSAWKIAFADFMTAMMALFLVMWLTNSTSDATKEQVAQYFNPIKLSDPVPAQRGLQRSTLGTSEDMKRIGGVPGARQGSRSGETASEGDDEQGEAEKEGSDDAAMFRDPYGVLAEIAAEGEPTPDGDPGGVPNGTGEPGLNGGDAYRDPFDPQSWQLEPNTRLAAETPAPVPVPAEFETAVEPAPVLTAAASDEAAGDAATSDAAVSDVPASEAAPAAEAAPDAAESEAAAMREAIAAAVAGTDDGRGVPPSVDVEAGEGGLTISLADSISGGMFEIGSAKPTAEAVAMMEKIAGVLAQKDGDVILRGHTDSRPFADGSSDNWQLSAARAQMAFYMLARGGLDEARVKRIEGVADRDPKLPDEPEAAANRRIEILLRTPEA